MNQTQLFKNRLLKNRGRLLDHFGVTKTYRIEQAFSLDALDRTKISTRPHDHTVSAEIDFRKTFAFIFSIDMQAYGILVAGDDPFEERLSPGTRELSLSLDIKDVRRLDASVTLSGLLNGGTSNELEWMDAGGVFEIQGLTHNDIPGEFYKETMAEALCLERDGRAKQSFFNYMSALDSLLNFQLRDLSTLSELKEVVNLLALSSKLSLAIKRSLDTNETGKIPLVSLMTNLFIANVEHRNAIAHSVKRVEVQEEMIHDAVFLLLAMQMIIQKKTADLQVLTDEYGLNPVPSAKGAKRTVAQRPRGKRNKRS